MTRSDGFSLLELLIALAITAALAGALVQAAGFGAEVWRRAAVASDHAPRHALRAALRRWIEAARPLTPGEPRPEGAVWTFWTDAAPPLRGIGERTRVALFRASDGSSAIDVEIALIGPGGLARRQERRRLVEGGAVSLRFFAQDQDAPPGRWLERWPWDDRLPALASIEVERGAEDERAAAPPAPAAPWPPFVVAPAVR